MTLIRFINNKVAQQVPKLVQKHESSPHLCSDHECRWMVVLGMVGVGVSLLTKQLSGQIHRLTQIQ